jgi:hypothetical protein
MALYLINSPWNIIALAVVTTVAVVAVEGRIVA